ncbi:2-phosphosulfolactate phosphatase [Paenibacillus sp. 1001270B_150601_E10]|uniref:2-phosphosulfolactate phosphatase n=1 Tax=Paenibacillus sp. 1001270B_150601_E10 TaxID=2787079 RepID=UPI00189C9A6F|nr:2-phosphosulfolactate phosphatase [Paenibacillus sp. 1001270B_150601_E10]
MHIDVIASVNEARAIDLSQRTVIVIDVLRATSTIVTALAHGASGVVPVETIGQAKQCATAGDLLGGERYCKKIPGFDLGNSPLEYAGEHVKGKRVILTTTNGTRAIQKSMRAKHILAGSLLNAKACAITALKLRNDIALLCAGTQEAFAFEDGVCAGMILHEMLHQPIHAELTLVYNDLGKMVMSAYRHHQDDLVHALKECASGKRLAKIGYADDIQHCAAINSIPIVPRFDQHMMIPFSAAI